MRKAGFSVAGVLVLFLLHLAFQSSRSTWYRFVSADDRLFAIEIASSYGTEQGVYVSNDLGVTWEAIEAPSKVHALTSNSERLVVATSTGEIWQKKTADQEWTRIWHSRGPNPYYYCVLASDSGDTFVVGKDSVIWVDADGQLVHEFQKPSRRSDPEELLYNATFANSEERQLILEASPFAIYVLDLDSRTLSPWVDVEGNSSSELNGPGRVRPLGSQFLLSHPTGIHVSSGLLEQWRMLNETIRQDDTIGGNFCRDLICHSSDHEQWIVATNSGIQLMEGSDEVRSIYSDSPGDHHLIREFTQHEGHYFVSFARLKNGCMGIRLSPDLSEWQPVKMALD